MRRFTSHGLGFCLFSHITHFVVAACLSVSKSARQSAAISLSAYLAGHMEVSICLSVCSLLDFMSVCSCVWIAPECLVYATMQSRSLDISAHAYQKPALWYFNFFRNLFFHLIHSRVWGSLPIRLERRPKFSHPPNNQAKSFPLRSCVEKIGECRALASKLHSSLDYEVFLTSKRSLSIWKK